MNEIKKNVIKSELDKAIELINHVQNLLNESQEIDDIVCKFEDICLGDTNTYYINTTDAIKWELTDNTGGLIITETDGNECKIKCKCDVKLIGKKETLTAIISDKEYTKEITIASLC